MFSDRIEKGIPVKGWLNYNFGYLQTTVNYDVVAVKYAEAWKKWHDQEALEADIKQQLDQIKQQQEKERQEKAAAKTVPQQQVKLEITADIADDAKSNIQSMAAKVADQEVRRLLRIEQERRTLNELTQTLNKSVVGQFLAFSVRRYAPPPPPEPANN